MDRSDLEAALDQLRHHRVDLGLQEHEIAHDHRHVPHRLERDPAAERERGPDRDAVERYLQVGARKSVAVNGAADGAGSSENSVDLRPVDALGIGSRGRRQRDTAGNDKMNNTHDGGSSVDQACCLIADFNLKSIFSFTSFVRQVIAAAPDEINRVPVESRPAPAPV